MRKLPTLFKKTRKMIRLQLLLSKSPAPDKGDRALSAVIRESEHDSDRELAYSLSILPGDCSKCAQTIIKFWICPGRALQQVEYLGYELQIDIPSPNRNCEVLLERKIDVPSREPAECIPCQQARLFIVALVDSFPDITWSSFICWRKRHFKQTCVQTGFSI